MFGCCSVKENREDITIEYPAGKFSNLPVFTLHIIYPVDPSWYEPRAPPDNCEEVKKLLI